MPLLIISGPGDVHASALAWAVNAYGIRALQWSPAPPWTRPGSVRFDGEGAVHYRFSARGGEVTPKSVDAVWLRRWPQPHFPPDLSEGDRLAARNELAAFHRGVLGLLPDHILWANPIAAREAAGFKLRQLAAARSVGFQIPETLVTDDAEEARRFVSANPGGSVVQKPFFTYHWRRENKLHDPAAPRVTAADLADPEPLIWSPGIFQKYVAKAFELRVSVFGRTCLAVRIPGRDPDDRPTSQDDMKVETWRLPAGVERRIHRLMDELGLVMGMIDILVTPEGDHVFLEVNEQGQFLWVEEMCPEVRLLDTCARFFASGTRFFQDVMVDSAELSFADFLKSAAYDEAEREERAFRSAVKVPDPPPIRGR